MSEPHAMQTLSAEELACKVQTGSDGCFTVLVKRYKDRLFYFLLNKTGNAEDAEDLVQETFIKAYQNIGRYKPSHRFSTWLFTIAGRLARSHYRKWRPSVESRDVNLVSADPVDVAAEREERQLLWTLARELPANHYEALWLKYAEDMSVREIAAVMSKTQIHVKVILCRARQGLAELLRSADDGCHDRPASGKQANRQSKVVREVHNVLFCL